ncbi:MAG: hypothetical protein M1409_05680, partial [Actinobacteria bacterium]|nr:hypothetical protein [Actinomycetota bacterium]
YMLTGSIVSSLQGEPRLTHDIDIVIILDKTDVKKIINSFPSDRYYCNENAIIKAIDNREQFNVIDLDEGDKIDFWILTESDFDKSRFSRKQKKSFLGFGILVSSPEDTILEKLYWSKISGGSEKQTIDALRVDRKQLPKLDMTYLEKWAYRLGIMPLLKKIKSIAGS